jgi:CheY-like chemotaxis protein
MKILIAEDDVIAEKVLRLTLQHFGHEVVTARNGVEAKRANSIQPVRRGQPINPLQAPTRDYLAAATGANAGVAPFCTAHR